MHHAIAELLQQSEGVIARRAYPELATRLDYAVRCGELVGVLPGVYALPEATRNWRAMVHAVSIWDDRAVIVGEAAAALTFWPELTPRRIEVASRRAYFQRPEFSFSQRAIPAAFVSQRAGLKIAHPALTAMDLVPRYGGDGIDRVLRSRMAKLSTIRDALELTSGRRHNPGRRQLLLDSRAEPWSEAERLAHCHLRDAGITRWHANVRIVCDGNVFYQDIAMDDCPVVIEIDGQIHLRADHFESDRRRGNYLLLAGKRVLHFTWHMLTEEPEWFIDTVQRAIAFYS